LLGGATALAYRLFMRRDFTDLAHDGFGRGVRVRVLTCMTRLPRCDRFRAAVLGQLTDGSET
jgi:hypothetical protein